MSSAPITSLTIRQVISQVKVPHKLVNTDSRVTNKYVYSLLKKHRDMLLKSVDSKFQLMKLSYLYQILKRVDLIPAPTIEECSGIKTNCVIYRSHEKLPYMVTASWGPIIRNVTSIDGYTSAFPITPMEWNRKQDNPDMKFNKTIYFYWQDGFLYFPNAEWRQIKVEAFFEEDIDKFNQCCDPFDPCKTLLDNIFRIPKELLSPCVELVNKEMLQLYDNVRPDENQIDKNDDKKQ